MISQTGECFHRFLEFSQTTMSVSVPHWKYRECVSIPFRKICEEKKETACLL